MGDVPDTTWSWVLSRVQWGEDLEEHLPVPIELKITHSVWKQSNNNHCARKIQKRSFRIHAFLAIVHISFVISGKIDTKTMKSSTLLSHPTPESRVLAWFVLFCQPSFVRKLDSRPKFSFATTQNSPFSNLDDSSKRKQVVCREGDFILCESKQKIDSSIKWLSCRLFTFSCDLFVEDLNFDNLRNKTGKSACYCISYWIDCLPLNFAKFAILQSSVNTPKEKKTWNRKLIL